MIDPPAIHPEEFKDPLGDYEPKTYEDPLAETLAEETVATIRCQPCAEVTPDTTIYHAMQALAGLSISSLLVVDSGKLVGVFTERDALERVAANFQELKDSPVTEVMTANPVVVYDTDPAGAALSAIAVAGYRHVPVLDSNEHVVGVVSPRRVLSFIRERL